MQLYMRRYGSNQISAAIDKGLLSWPLPDHCTLNYLNGEVHVVANVPQALQIAVLYTSEGWVLQSDVAADFENMDTLWDKFVPKDNDTIDWDSSAALDTTTMNEPGMINVAQLLDQEIGEPVRFYKREKMLTLANAVYGFVPSSDLWIPVDLFRFGLGGKKLTARENSGVVIGFGSPDTAVFAADDDVVPNTTGSSMDAFQTLRNIESLMSFAMIEATAFTETGAESPFEDIANFLINVIESTNENTVLFTALTWNTFAKGIAGIRTPARVMRKSLGPDAQAS